MVNSKEKILKDVNYSPEKKVSPLDVDDNKTRMNHYIFDESKVLKNKVFTQDKLNENTFAYGLNLPREIDMKNKFGEVVGQEQVWSPVLITSDCSLIEATKEVEMDYKIKFNDIPQNLQLRWSLELIKSYLEGNNSIPELTPLELFNKIKEKYEEFCFFKESTWYKLNSLWDGGTYLFNLFDNFPIKEERGLAGTGKTKCMKISKNISFNGSEIMINPSEATLFRETNSKRMTKYIDEAEKLFTFKKGLMESDNRVELINGSYSKGSTIPRLEKIKDKYVCFYYNVYSPTRIGSINGLFGATESRTITQVHTRSLDTDRRGEKEPQDNDPDFLIIRDYLYLFGLKYWKQVEECYKNNSLYENLKIKKRDLQIWKPLLSLAKVISEDWFNEIVSFAEKISLQKKEELLQEDSWDYRILSVIKELLDCGTQIIRPKKIREVYNEKFSNETEKTPYEKSITTRLDHLGFKELKQPRDREGISYKITEENFYIIASPISDLVNYSSHSSHSSHSLSNAVTNDIKSVTNDDELLNEGLKDLKKCDENVENVENVEYLRTPYSKTDNLGELGND